MDTYAKAQRGSAFSAATLVIFGLFVAITPFIRLAAGINEHGSAAPTCVLTEVDIEAPYANNGDAPEIFADGAVLIDGRSREILYSKECDKRLPMASTTKIMTALVAAETLSGDEYVKVPKECAGIEGSSIYLEVGETVSVKTLLYGLMLESGNDAAYTLAATCSGSIGEFCALMNKKAKDMGLIDTHFTNPHGLHDENHYTTAYELCVIASEALENDTFRKIVSTKSMYAKSTFSDAMRYFSNHNKLLRSYSGANGVKTGFTKKAGRCLVTSAERDEERFVAVTLNDGNDWRDHTAMLDFGFENSDTLEIADKNSFYVYSESGIKHVPSESIYITVPKGEKHKTTYKMSFEKNGAFAEYFIDGKKSGSFSLVSMQ